MAFFITIWPVRTPYLGMILAIFVVLTAALLALAHDVYDMGE